MYECNLNIIFANKCKEAISNSEKQGILYESQFGSRRVKSSQIPVLIEILQLDLSIMTRKQYGQIN
jgi:hypothetical protein